MFKIKIAELIIEIDNRYNAVERLCKDYIVESKDFAFQVRASDEDIAREKQFGGSSDAYCESVCIYRNIVKKIPEYDAFFLHAAVVEVDGRAYAFMAQSGTGKTTHVKLWCDHFGERARIINGDKPILRFSGTQLLAYGTPWCGKEGYNINTSTPIQGMCFIERSNENSIRIMNSSEVIVRIFYQMIMPKEESSVDKVLEFLDRLIQLKEIWVLQCNISQEAVKVSYEAMSGQSYES